LYTIAVNIIDGISPNTIQAILYAAALAHAILSRVVTKNFKLSKTFLVTVDRVLRLDISLTGVQHKGKKI